MQKNADVIIVGAGVIGLLTAMELASRGVEVLVVERGRAGMESSRAGGGILAPIPPWRAAPEVDALARLSQPEFPVLAATLLDSTGIDIEYTQCGAVLLGETLTPEVRQWATTRGCDIKQLGAAGLAELEPQLAPGWSKALLLPQVGQLRNPRLMTALGRHLRNIGVTILEQQPVTALLQTNGMVDGVAVASGRLQAPAVVLACGAWTSRVLAEFDVAGIAPVRGQMLWYRLQPGDFARVIIEDDRYLIPRRDGVCLVGSTVEQAGFDQAITTAAAAELARFAARLSPRLDGLAPAGQWSGLRPGRDTGIPVIAAHPAVAGLYINAGHHRNGINLAPASARLCADLLQGGKPRVDPGPYAAWDHLYSAHD